MYPRRVKDLPPLETDSEDEPNTPLKQKIPNSTKCYSNKDNLSYCSKNRLNQNINSCGKLWNFPKRSSELPTLESDSEEEDYRKDDNLNCAILNESVIITPIKEEPKIGRSTSNYSQCPGGINFTDGINQNFADSLVGRFHQIGINHNTRPNSEQHSTSPSAYSNSDHCKTNRNENKSSISDLGIPEDKEIATVKRFNSEPSTESNEPQFITPRIQSFPCHRRPGDICSTQSQKTRSAIVNEFRSQKVLFQTPLATTRAPKPSLTNDSLTLSLCDSINETYDNTSNTKKPQSENGIEVIIKSEKSLDGIFNDIDKKEAGLLAKPVEKQPSVAATSASVPNDNSQKETLLEINNVNYSILQKLGAGGSSSVYLALNKNSGNECALKIVDLHGDAAIVEGYLNETKLLAKLQGNVCVVSLYDYQLKQKESKLYMVMEKGDSDLSKILQRYRTSLPLYVLMNFWYQMLQAVNYIHQNGVIHSDLKPANFLMVNGRLKLIDFGIASNIAVDSTSIIKYSQAGTFNYISPEALTDTSTGSSPIRNQPKIKISPKSDIWSLGCILYLLIYKKTPFSHILSIYAKINAISNPSPSIDYPPMPFYYPPILLQMVKSCLQHNPKQRPSCAELLQYPFHMIIPIKNLTLAPT